MLLLSQESCFWMEACAWQVIDFGVDVSGHEEQAKSAVEKQSANAVVRTVAG